MSSWRQWAWPVVAGLLAGLLIVQWRTERLHSRESFADAAERAARSVVNVYTRSVVPTRSHPLCALPRFAPLCEEQQRMQSSLGSGVVVGEEGYVLTNEHVVAGADEITIAFIDGTTTAATVVGRDRETDLAVLRTAIRPAPGIATGSARDLRVGDVVLAIGNPFGFGQTVSQGIVSAKGRYSRADSPFEEFLQTDAAINPGNSGGALVDVQGRLVGINSMIFSKSGGSEGIGFAIPVELALGVLEAIVRTGHVTRGWLGIEVRDAADVLEVHAVVPDGPAWNAGLRRGDRITAINGARVRDGRATSRQVAVAMPGDEVQLTIERDGRALLLTAVAGIRPPR